MHTFVAAVFLAMLAALLTAADGEPARDAAFFERRFYPLLEKAQCRQCHNDNGVASRTRLQFPHEKASAEEIRAFGLGLKPLVNRDDPEGSLLLRKPTNRVPHTGGERIPQGSDEEKIVRAWIAYLAKLPADQPAIAAAKGSKKGSEAPVRRLTHSQYNHTVRDLLGDRTQPAAQFPPEDFVHGFTNQAEGQGISPLLAEAYNQAAEKLARNAFLGGDRNKLIPCVTQDAACRSRFVREFGRRAFRRPLSEAEIRRYESLFQLGESRGGEFLRGARMVVEAMLQSPNFLFHVPRNTQAADHYHTANRLSYFLWDTMPDVELFRAADAGELGTPAGIEKTARRMLADPRARLAMDEFLEQWLRFDRLRNAVRDRRLFPEFSTELVASMTEETRRLFNHLIWENGDFREFFRADYGFLSSDLARLYALPAPPEEFALVNFPADSERGGILGQATFLALTSKPAETSPTERGLFIREHFLCQIVPPPPAGVNTTLPPVTDEKPMTTLERLQIHLSDQTCAGCHRLIDPIGFGFERYDAIGKFRTTQQVTIYPTADELKNKIKTKPTEYRLDIDAAGSVSGIPNSEFTSPRQAGKLLAEDPGCQKCVVKQLFRYAAGRTETQRDRAAIDSALARFQNSQFRFQELIISIVTSEPFLEE